MESIMEKFTYTLYKNGLPVASEYEVLPMNGPKAEKKHFELLKLTNTWREQAQNEPDVFGFVSMCNDGTGEYPYEWVGSAPSQKWTAAWIRDVSQEVFARIWDSYNEAIELKEPKQLKARKEPKLLKEPDKPKQKTKKTPKPKQKPTTQAKSRTKSKKKKEDVIQGSFNF